MTVKELQNLFLDGLKHLYPNEEIHSFFHQLVNYQLNFSRADIVLKSEVEMNEDDLDFFQKTLKELQKEIPIQYILGETEFYGLNFKVSKDVLIPRPETEELVQWMVDEIKSQQLQDQNINILDIGTGSGCIAIALATKLSNASIYALDVSEKALEIAKQNALLNKVKIHFIKQDILNTNVISVFDSKKEKSLYFDIVVSNPPYVREKEKLEIKKNVLDHEPHLALFVNDENPLLFYDKITDIACRQLKKNGHLFLEINQYLSYESVLLLENKGFQNIKLKKDLFGNDRMIKAKK